MSEHTPTPWSVELDDDHWSDKGGAYVVGNPTGQLGGNRKLAYMDATYADPTANAEFIVLACNSHNALVTALSGLVNRIEYYASLGEEVQKNIEDWAYTDASSDMERARSALAAAGAA